MLNQLKNNIKTIYDELNTKLIPDNIKKGVTILNVEGAIEGQGVAYTLKEQVDNISVTKPDSGSYTFALNSNGYYESNNKGVNSSYALCKVTFNALYDGCSLVVDCISYGENNFDYGILSKIDTTLTSSSSADSTNVAKSFYGLSSPKVQRYIYGNISVGEHYIYIKYRKDSSGHSYNDSLQFKIIPNFIQYSSMKIYTSEDNMNNDIEQLDSTYATIDTGNQVFKDFYKYNEATRTWDKVQTTVFTAGSYLSTTEFQKDTIHYGPDYIGIINNSNGIIPFNPYKAGETKIDKFDDIVTLTNEVTENEKYHLDNIIGTEEDYYRGSVSIDLTRTQFKLEQYREESRHDKNVENYVVIYESTDGLTYTQSKNTFVNSVNIHNDSMGRLSGNYDERIGKFLYTTGNVFGGLYYKTNSGSTPSRLSNQLYCDNSEIPNDYTVYANNGVVSGTLYNKPTGSNDFTAKFNVYGRLKEMLEDSSLYENADINLDDYKNTTLPITTFGNLRRFDVHNGNIETANLTFDNVENRITFHRTNNLKSVDLKFTSISNVNFFECTKLETIKLSGKIRDSHLSFNENRKLKSIDLTNLTFENNLTSMSNCFTNCSSITSDNLPALDTSLVTSFDTTFANCVLLTSVPAYDYSNNTSLSLTFDGCVGIADVSALATQGNLTTISYAFRGCTNLVTVPQFDLSHFTSSNYSYTFESCGNLSNDSLNNILATLATVPTNITSNRTFKYCGLSAEQCYKCKSLSNYQTAIDSGWTTGYTDDELNKYATT